MSYSIVSWKRNYLDNCRGKYVEYLSFKTYTFAVILMLPIISYCIISAWTCKGWMWWNWRHGSAVRLFNNLPGMILKRCFLNFNFEAACVNFFLLKACVNAWKAAAKKTVKPQKKNLCAQKSESVVITPYYHEILAHLFWWNLLALTWVPVSRETEKSVFPSTQDKSNNCVIYMYLHCSTFYSKGYLQVWSQIELSDSLVNLKSIFNMPLFLVLWMYGDMTIFIWWPMDKY